MSPAERWGFWRWYRESRSFMSHKPWWWVLPRAIAKWPAFNRKQRTWIAEIRDRRPDDRAVR